MADPKKIENGIQRVRNQKAFIQELLIDAPGWDINQRAEDVEKVARRFYEDYAAVFEKVETLIAEHCSPHEPRAEDGTRRVPATWQGDDLRMFTQTLFNRLMFLRFVECKGWLMFAGRKDYLRALYAAHCSPHAPCAEDGTRHVPATNKKSFYKGRLCPLFFEGLAVEGKQQSEAYGQVPYLGGGLFERSDLDKQVSDLPDEVFAGILADGQADGLFYRYDFTVEESTPLDIEVAVDPEMLGKVFEELVTGRHESGAYYTPRPVVSFMCRQALKGYLLEKLFPSPSVRGENTEQAIVALVDRHDVGRLEETQAREIVTALDDLKAVDPACGSGAYLLGLLQEMIALYRLLYSDKLVKDARPLYDLKLRIINQSLYGVDIDPFATNIAKLRLWLSLAVEADKPVPLPNLDFKIETGDSLLAPNPQESPDLSRGVLQASADALAKAKQQFFVLHGAEKEACRKKIVSQESYLRKELAARPGQRVVDWRIQFAEAFADRRGGFDLVLANPPYVDSHTMVKNQPDYRVALAALFSTAKGTWDLYVPFWERSLQLLAPGGIATLITPNKWLSIGYGKALCALSRGMVYQISDYSSFRAFATLGVAPIVVSMKKRGSEQIERQAFPRWPPPDAPLRGPRRLHRQIREVGRALVQEPRSHRATDRFQSATCGRL